MIISIVCIVTKKIKRRTEYY